MKRLVMLLTVLALPAALAAQDAQNVAKGFAVDKSYQVNDADSINTFNGNLNISIPLGRRFNVSSALSYQLYLTYGGNVWDFDSREITVQFPNRDKEQLHLEWAFVDSNNNNAGIGWNVSLGRFSEETYYGADGAEHRFFAQLHNENPVSGVRYTRDGSYLRATTEGGVTKVEFPDGTYQTFRSDGRLTAMKDRFGNSVTITYTPGNDEALDWEIRDGSRVHKVDFKRVGEPGSYTYDVIQSVKFDSDPDKDPAEIFFGYVGGSEVLSGLSRQLAVDQDCEKSGVVLAPVLESVTLVDGSKYQMTTDNGDADQLPNGSWTGTFASADGTGSNASRNCAAGATLALHTSFSGHLKELKHPTGARTAWEYQKYTFPVFTGAQPQCADVASCHIAASTQAAVGVKERYDYVRDSEDPKTKRTYDQGEVGTATKVTTLTTYALVDGQWSPVSQSLHYYDTPFGQADRLSYGQPFTRLSGAAPTAQSNPDSRGRYLSSKLLDGAGRLLRYNYVAYEADNPLHPPGSSENRRMKSERVVTLDGSAETAGEKIVSDVETTSSDFDGFGHYRTTTTTTTAPATGIENVPPRTTRTVTTSYNNPAPKSDPNAPTTGAYPGSTAQPFVMWPTPNADPKIVSEWILNTYSSQTTQEIVNGATSTTKALFVFDRRTGFLEQRRLLKDIGSGADSPNPHDHDLLSVFAQVGGNVAAESYYGGDGQSIGTESLVSTTLPSSPVTSLIHTYQYGALKTSRYGGMSYDFVDRTIDPYTGLTTKSKDPGGVETSFAYDPSGRLKRSELTLNATSSLVTEYAFKAATPDDQALVTVQQRAGTIVFTTAKVEYDDFGRVWLEKRTMPNNLESARKTLYDERGSVRSVSEWASLASMTDEVPDNVTAYTYDALGRLSTAVLPDQSVTKYSYIGGRTTTRTSHVATNVDNPATNADDLGTPESTIETTDDLGRLIQVEEPTGTVTRYGYDVGGHLASVNMTGPSILQAGTTDSQDRAFTYDGRGFLTSERHPETGTTNYKYDARGQVTERTAGGTTVTFEYDPAERLKRVAEGVKTLKSFTFDRPNDGNDKSLGKPDTAVRHNYGTPHDDLTVTETFRYEAPGGRLSAKETKLSHTGQIFTDSYTYDTLGAVKTLTYPACASCPSREITNEYKAGLLTGVVGYTTTNGITYSSNGMVSSVRHLNNGGTLGPRDTQTYDTTTGMARPLEIAVSDFTANDCSTPPSADITAPSTMHRNDTAQAFVPAASDPTATYAWTITGGSVVSGQNTRTFTFKSECGSSSVTLTVSVTSFHCTKSSTQTITTDSPASATLQVAGSTTVPWTTPPTSRTINVVLTGMVGGSGTWSDGTLWSYGNGSFTHSVAPPATTTYSVSGLDSFGCAVTSNSVTLTVTPPTPALTATAVSATRVSLSWSMPATYTADLFEIQRRTSGGTFTIAGPTTTATSWSENTGADKAYLYRVRARKDSTYSDWSNLELATTILFSDDPVVSFSTTMRAQYISELRTAVNAVRTLAGLPPATFTDPGGVDGLLPKTAYVQELRNGLAQARTTLGLPAVTFTDPALASGGLFKAIYINQLRGGVQ
jgi:YD repeat-containing protein